MKFYLSGPMSGMPEANYPAFRAAASRLRALGHEVIDPSENFDGDRGRQRHEYMRLDVQHVLDADGVVVLEGWQGSAGARLEVAIAQEIGIPVLDVNTLKPYRESALLEAHRLVHGDRGHSYGPPSRDFARTALIWDALFGHRMKDGERFKPEDVGLAMIAVKLSREVNRPRRDNRVDLGGYAETVDMIWQEREAAV